jgi:HK97 family phage major capsid protein
MTIESTYRGPTAREHDAARERRDRERGWTTAPDTREKKAITEQIRRQQCRAAFNAQMRGRADDIDRSRLLDGNSHEFRDQGVGAGSAGGFLVPNEWLPRLTLGMKRGSAMVRAYGLVTTDGGGPLRWAFLDDTSNVSAIQAENTPVAEHDLSILGRTLGAFVYPARLSTSWQLLQDAGVDIEERIGTALGRRIGRAVNSHLTVGTGGGTQPAGIVPNSTVGFTGAAAAGITAAELAEIVASVDPDYVRPHRR